MRRKQRNQPEEVKGDMTPMIDIIFQLLIFFMLTMNFKEIEGKINSHLPKDKGLGPTVEQPPELRELRIAVIGSAAQAHIAQVRYEQRPIGEVRMRVDASGEMTGGEDPTNEGVWLRMEKDVERWFRQARITAEALGERVPPLKIDTEKTPAAYQFVVQVLDRAKKLGIERVEFVGSDDNHEFERFENR
jgi:biopolymer transport protein ExbD